MAFCGRGWRRRGDAEGGRTSARRPKSLRPCRGQSVGRALGEAVPSFVAFLAAIFTRSRVTRSSVHGTAHWRETASIAAELLRSEPRADPVVALVFALAHDALRADDLDDSAHGIRERGPRAPAQCGRDSRA